MIADFRKFQDFSDHARIAATKVDNFEEEQDVILWLIEECKSGACGEKIGTVIIQYCHITNSDVFMAMLELWNNSERDMMLTKLAWQDSRA